MAGEIEPSVPPRDWPAEAAETVVRVVDTVRSKTTANVVLVAKAIVYGTLALVLGIAILLWLLIVVFRFIDNYLPFDSDSSWDAWLLLAIVFLVAGSAAWIKRGRIEEPTPV
jgi:hypothetical protein